MLFPLNLFSQFISGKPKSFKIRDMIYESEWYNLQYSRKLDKKYKEIKFMLMMNLMRANKVERISAGGMAFLTYESFMAVFFNVWK